MNYNESDIEDWLESNLAKRIHPNCQVVGRQVTLPSGGRMDLLLAHHSASEHFLTVVEVRRGTANMDAVHQLIRYMDEVEAASWENVTTLGLLVAEGFTKRASALIERLPRVASAGVLVWMDCDIWNTPMDTDEFSDVKTPPDRLVEEAFASRSGRGAHWHSTEEVRGVLWEKFKEYFRGVAVPRHKALVRVVNDGEDPPIRLVS